MGKHTKFWSEILKTKSQCEDMVLAMEKSIKLVRGCMDELTYICDGLRDLIVVCLIL
jgi:hypothetical protein